MVVNGDRLDTVNFQLYRFLKHFKQSFLPHVSFNPGVNGICLGHLYGFKLLPLLLAIKKPI